MSVRAVADATLAQSDPILNITVFSFVAVTPGCSFSGPQNGFVIAALMRNTDPHGGSVLDLGTEDRRLAAEREVCSLTGYGAEKAVEH